VPEQAIVLLISGEADGPNGRDDDAPHVKSPPPSRCRLIDAERP
jgi:hypothetical protein